MNWPRAMAGMSPNAPVVQACAAKSGADHQYAPNRVPRRSRGRRRCSPSSFSARAAPCRPGPPAPWPAQPGGAGHPIPGTTDLPALPGRRHRRAAERAGHGAKFCFRQRGQRPHRLVAAAKPKLKVTLARSASSSASSRPASTRHSPVPGQPGNRPDLLGSNVLPLPRAPGKARPDSASPQARRTRRLPEPELLEQAIPAENPR